MSIKILASHPAIDSGREFTESELKHIKYLEEDEFLESFLKECRKGCNIPEEGFNLNKPIKSYGSQFNKVHYNKLARDAMALGTLYNLPSSWATSVINIILFNLATPPEKIRIESKGSEVMVTIRERLSIDDIKKFLGKNKKVLDKLQKLRILRATGIEIKKRMKELRKAGTTPDKIENLIKKEYGTELGFDPNYPTVNKYLFRFKNYLKENLENKDWKGALQQLQETPGEKDS